MCNVPVKIINSCYVCFRRKLIFSKKCVRILLIETEEKYVAIGCVPMRCIKKET